MRDSNEIASADTIDNLDTKGTGQGALNPRDLVASSHFRTQDFLNKVPRSLVRINGRRFLRWLPLQSLVFMLRRATNAILLGPDTCRLISYYASLTNCIRQINFFFRRYSWYHFIPLFNKIGSIALHHDIEP